MLPHWIDRRNQGDRRLNVLNRQMSEYFHLKEYKSYELRYGCLNISNGVSCLHKDTCNGKIRIAASTVTNALVLLNMDCYNPVIHSFYLYI